MPLDRELWNGTFPREEVPPLPCPSCRHGHLVLDKGTLHVKEPAYSKNYDDRGPETTVERFAALLRCSNASCGEFVAVSGDIDVVEHLDEEFGWTFIGLLRPHIMFPGPPIIFLPDETPDTVADQIKLAFQLFWSDLGASASRLRTSVERILDDFGIPAQGVNKKGKSYHLDLSARIDAFKKVNPDHAATFDALRLVGNVGTHAEELKREALLDAFEVYEHALAEIYGQHSKKIQAMRAKIIAAKGKYS